MRRFLARYPWIWVVIAFGVLITAWTIFISIALKNQPEPVPLRHAASVSHDGR